MRNFTAQQGLTIYTADNRPLTLDREIGKGGEGSVWSITGAPSLVAKFYHQGLDAAKAKKIETMCRLKSERLLRVAAWPTDLLKAGVLGPPQGLLMPRINDYQAAHLLYTPKSRRTRFPDAQLPFVLYAAVNAARAFETVHEAGQVIGDVNHANLMISRDARVALIDCDSFEITDGQTLFPCPVGVPTYTPPELQGRSFHGVRRTQQHDAFGLAVLLFHMLFLGRHPFSGIFRQGTDNKSIEDAIREFRFAYLPDKRLTEMEQPIWVPGLSAFPADIGNLFRRAFSREGANGKRPSAHEWIPALESLLKDLKRCSANSSHHYFQALSACPWCVVEKASGIPMFGLTVTVLNMKGFDIAAVWAQIEAVQPDTSGTPQFASAYADQCEPDARIEEIKAERREISAERRKNRMIGVGAIVLAMVIVIPGSVPAPFAICLLIGGLALAGTLWGRAGTGGKQFAAAKQFKTERENALRAFQAARARWDVVERPPEAFVEAKKRLQTQKQELRDLPSERAARIAELRSQMRGKQLTRFLERHRIENEAIEGIGRGRIALLRAWGIDDASDVHPSINIRGFGPVLKSNLLAWRASLEQQFVFNPNADLDPADQRMVEQQLAQKMGALVQSLSNGPQVLKQILLPWHVERSSALANIDLWAKAVAQSEVNIKALGRL